MDTVYFYELKKRYIYNVVFSFILYILITVSCSTVYAQQYYWSKASNFPDTDAGIEAVTDLEAADGIIRYNGRQYAYESDFIFKRVETLVNKDETTPGNFFWTGPEGKWIFRDEAYTIHDKMYTLDGSTKQLTTICTTSNLGSYSDLNESSIVFFKNRYYALGAVSDENSREVRVLRRFNSNTCQWDIIPLPSNPKIEGMDKMITDGTTLYIIATDNTLGDAIFYGTEDVITWNTVVLPASLHITSWFYPKQELMSDKRGFVLLKRSEDTQVTGDVITRFFSMKDQVFTPIAMGGDQPVYGYWGSFKSFDSGNIFSLSIDQKELLKSTDKGNSWTKIVTVNIPDEINDYIETRDGNIYIGTASGVYVLKKFKEQTVTGCTDLTYKKKITNEVRCKKGAVTVEIDGGVAPYTIRFQNKILHTSDSIIIDELKTGYYEIRIEDAANCYVDTDFYVNIDIKHEMEVTVSDKNTCNGDLVVVMQHGYPPYSVTYTVGGLEEKKQIIDGPVDGYSAVVHLFNLDKEEIYTFAVSDQSGCSAILSPPQQGGFFKPLFTYTGTDDCDSVAVGITIPHAVASDVFEFTIRNTNYQVLKKINWTGAAHIAKVAHNAFYYFEVVSNQSQCISGQIKNFSKPELVSLAVGDIHCNGQVDIKGNVFLTLQNITSVDQQIIWSDIGVNNVTFRTDLDAGIYSFQIPEETGCGINRTFEIKKEVPDVIIPEIPFLCPGEIFHLVPETSDNINPIAFEVINQNNNQTLFLNKGDGFDIVNDVAASYEIAANNINTNCYSEKVTVTIETPDSAPILQKNTYTFCEIGDQIVITNSSRNAYWYSGSDNTLLGQGISIAYTTTRPKDSIYVRLEGQDGTCTSLSSLVKLKQSDIMQPEIVATSTGLHTNILKPKDIHDDLAITYSWYSEDGLIDVIDSLLVSDGQWDFIELLATDENGCVAIKSEKYYPNLALGVNQSSANNFLTVFPNPTSDKLFIHIDKSFNTGMVKMKDMNGRNVCEWNINQNVNEISLSAFSSGLYIVDVQLDNQEVVHVLVVKY